VLNVLPGFGSTAGAAITSHMDIDAVIWIQKYSMPLIKLKMHYISNKLGNDNY